MIVCLQFPAVFFVIRFLHMYLKSLFLDEFPVLQILICHIKCNYIKYLETDGKFQCPEFFLIYEIIVKILLAQDIELKFSQLPLMCFAVRSSC